MDWVGFAETWVKALHVISVIAWIAGMMYLPRLFVYHSAAEKGSIQSETFKLMERRLYRGIITPAMILTWVFGLTMVFTPGIIDWSQGWVWVKAIAVILLTAMSDREHMRQGMTAGADDYLTKPYRPDELCQAIAAGPW